MSWWRWKWYSSTSFFRASSSCPFLMFFLGYYDKRIAAWRRPPKSKGTHTTLAPIARLISFLFSCSFRCWSLCLLAHQGLGTKNSKKKKKSLKEPTIREAFNSNNSQHTSSVQTRNWERLNRFSQVFFFYSSLFLIFLWRLLERPFSERTTNPGWHKSLKISKIKIFFLFHSGPKQKIAIKIINKDPRAMKR